jgi:hypothetical protein
MENGKVMMGNGQSYRPERKIADFQQSLPGSERKRGMAENLVRKRIK